MEKKQAPISIDRILQSINQYSRLKNRNGVVNGEKPVEIFRTDLISAMQLADSEALQPEQYWPLLDNWRIEWEKGVQVPVELEKAHKPKITVVDTSGAEEYFKLPNKHVHLHSDDWFSKGKHELSFLTSRDEESCRYDLDASDSHWLELLNQEREHWGQTSVSELSIERIMESLETSCYENMKIALRTAEGCGIEFDEHIVCDVCRMPESEDGNEMVFCDGCDMCVHQACYGIENIPEGAWLCRICARGLPPPPCMLCPKRGGAMKSTRSGLKWAHVSCALWIPEVSIGEAEKMEPVTKISEIPASRWALVCCLCRERAGACIQCCVRTCKTAFHVTCAFDHGLVMKTLFASKEHQHIMLNAYCLRHSKIEFPEEFNKLQSTPKKQEISKEEKENSKQQKIREIETNFYKLVDAEEISKDLQLDTSLVQMVYTYWKLKRTSYGCAPLLLPRAAQAELLSQLQEDGIVARMKMFVRLRQDLERVRNLCYMVVRREKTKRFLLRCRRKLFNCKSLALGVSRLSEREVLNIVQSKPRSVYDQPAIHLRNAAALDAQMEREREEDLRLLQEEQPTMYKSLKSQTRQKRGRTSSPAGRHSRASSSAPDIKRRKPQPLNERLKGLGGGSTAGDFGSDSSDCDSFLSVDSKLSPVKKKSISFKRNCARSVSGVKKISKLASSSAEMKISSNSLPKASPKSVRNTLCSKKYLARTTNSSALRPKNRRPTLATARKSEKFLANSSVVDNGTATTLELGQKCSDHSTAKKDFYEQTSSVQVKKFPVLTERRQSRFDNRDRRTALGGRLRERVSRSIEKVRNTRGFVEMNGLKTLPENKLDEYIQTLTGSVVAPAESVKLHRRQSSLSSRPDSFVSPMPASSVQLKSRRGKISSLKVTQMAATAS